MTIFPAALDRRRPSTPADLLCSPGSQTNAVGFLYCAYTASSEQDGCFPVWLRASRAQTAQDPLHRSWSFFLHKCNACSGRPRFRRVRFTRHDRIKLENAKTGSFLESTEADLFRRSYRSSSFWLPVFHASKLAEQRRVVAYDFDGHGHKSEFSGETSIASLVQDLKDVLDGLQIPKAVLLVHSMSGVSLRTVPQASIARIN